MLRALPRAPAIGRHETRVAASRGAAMAGWVREGNVCRVGGSRRPQEIMSHSRRQPRSLGRRICHRAARPSRCISRRPRHHTSPRGRTLHRGRDAHSWPIAAQNRTYRASSFHKGVALNGQPLARRKGLPNRYRECMGLRLLCNTGGDRITVDQLKPRSISDMSARRPRSILPYADARFHSSINTIRNRLVRTL